MGPVSLLASISLLFYYIVCDSQWKKVDVFCALASRYSVMWSGYVWCCMHVLMHVQNDITEPNWHVLVFDKLTNEQAVTHYSRHHLTALVACVTTPISQFVKK